MDPAVWYDAFREALRKSRSAERLREAADGARLGPWTKALTEAVVSTCRSFGWEVAAKGFPAKGLPFSRQEVLGIDVTAFLPVKSGGKGADWRLPAAVFELENSQREEIIAYALWKVCAVRAGFRGLFCFRPEEEAVGPLARSLGEEVVRRGRLLEDGDSLLLIVGTRGKAGTFPDGYFKPFVGGKAGHGFRRMFWAPAHPQ